MKTAERANAEIGNVAVVDDDRLGPSTETAFDDPGRVVAFLFRSNDDFAATEEAVSSLHEARREVAHAQRKLLDSIVACDRAEVWDDDGCRDLAHWLAIHLGISAFQALRLINAAYVLPSLPLTEAAFLAGELSLDKVVQLCRFATPQDEKPLIRWAKRVSLAAVRDRADVETRPDRNKVSDDNRSRFAYYVWTQEGRGLSLQAYFPADMGAVIAKGLDRGAGRRDAVVDPEQEQPSFTDDLETRRADVLFMWASSALAADPDADRATVVVHAELSDLVASEPEHGCAIQDGGVLHPEVARRLLCDCRLETVVHAGDKVVGIGRASRTPPPWIVRQLRKRDYECSFPGCHHRYFMHAHHIWHWVDGGPTNLDNLVLVCTFHHKLLHELGWKLKLEDDGVTWFRPDGRKLEPD